MTRIVPGLDPRFFRTFRVSAPLGTHWRPATCDEVDCPNYLNGWRTIVPANSDHAELVRSLKNRYRFTEAPQDGGLVAFTFPAGQFCFEARNHRIRLDRLETFIRLGGDWRGNPTGERVVHSGPEPWLDDMQENLEGVRRRAEQG